METLVSYTEQNEGKVSTPYVQEIVQQTNDNFASIDPLEKRYEENKSRVPRYDKNGQYAAVSAMRANSDLRPLHGSAMSIAKPPAADDSIAVPWRTTSSPQPFSSPTAKDDANSRR